MTDTLKDRAEKFRGGPLGYATTIHGAKYLREALIAEIKWARENPPFSMPSMPETEDIPKYVGHTFARLEYEKKKAAWQSALDHILNCLGEK